VKLSIEEQIVLADALAARCYLEGDLEAAFRFHAAQIGKRGSSLSRMGNYALGKNKSFDVNCAIDEFNGKTWTGAENFVIGILALGAIPNKEFKVLANKAGKIQCYQRDKYRQYVDPKTGLKVTERNFDDSTWVIIPWKVVVTGLLKPRDGSKPRSYESRTRDWGCFILSAKLHIWNFTPKQLLLVKSEKRIGTKHQHKLRELLKDQGPEKFLGWFLSPDKDEFKNQGAPPKAEEPEVPGDDEQTEDDQQTFALQDEEGNDVRLKIDELSNKAKQEGSGDWLPESEEKALLEDADAILATDDEEIAEQKDAQQKEQAKLTKPSTRSFVLVAWKKFVKNSTIKQSRSLLADMVMFFREEEARQNGDTDQTIKAMAEQEAGALNSEEDSTGHINIVPEEADGPDSPVYDA
jgi:hypothetical protein